MHADVACTHVFRELDKMKDYNLDWLKKTVKSMIEKKAEAATIPPLRHGDDNDIDFKFHVVFIVDPIINIFEDYKGLNCMAINYGYNYFYDQYSEIQRLHLQLDLEGEILGDIGVLIPMEYGECGAYFRGICLDSSYVAYFKSKKLCGGHSAQIYVETTPEGETGIDQYNWAVLKGNRLVEINSSIIYSMLPKDKITLPNKEVTRSVIDTSKL